MEESQMNDQLSLGELFDSKVYSIIQEKLFSWGVEYFVGEMIEMAQEPWKSQRIVNDVVEHLTEQMESLSTEEEDYIITQFMHLALSSDFPVLLDQMIQNLHTNICHVASKHLFYREFKGWVTLLLEDFPTKKGQIMSLFCQEYKSCADSFFVDTTAFRPLKGIEEDAPDIAARQILRAFGDISESRYVSYMQVVYQMYQICNLTDDEPVESLNPGRLATILTELFNCYYPDYGDLIDMWVITVRNANAHGNFRFDYQTNQLTIFNINSSGREVFHRDFTVTELKGYFDRLVEAFWTGGLFHRVCLDIILSDYENWKGQISDLMEKLSQESEIQQLLLG